MNEELILTIGHIAIIALLGLFGAAVFRNSFRLVWFVGALLLYALYNFLLTRAFFPFPIFLPLRTGIGWGNRCPWRQCS